MTEKEKMDIREINSRMREGINIWADIMLMAEADRWAIELDYFPRVNEDKSHGHDFKPQDGGGTAFTVRTAPGNRVDDNFVFNPKED